MPVQKPTSIEIHFGKDDAGEDISIMGANFLVLTVDEKGNKTVTAKDSNGQDVKLGIGPVGNRIAQKGLPLEVYMNHLKDFKQPKYITASNKIKTAEKNLESLLKASDSDKLFSFEHEEHSFYLCMSQDKKPLPLVFDRKTQIIEDLSSFSGKLAEEAASLIKSNRNQANKKMALFEALNEVTRSNNMVEQLQPERVAKIEKPKVEELKVEKSKQPVSGRKKGSRFKNAVKKFRGIFGKNSSVEITSPSKPQESIGEQPVIKPREAAPLPPQQRGPAPLPSQPANIASDYETVDNFEGMEGSNYATADDFDDASPSPSKPDAIKEGPKNLDVTLLYSGSFMVHYGEDIYTLADFEKKYSNDQDLIIGVWDKVSLLKASMKEDMIKDAHGSMTEEEAEKQINQQLQTAISDSEEDIYSIPHTSPDLPPRGYNTGISRLQKEKVEIETAIERIEEEGIDASMQAQAMHKLGKPMGAVTSADIIGLLKEQIQGIDAQIKSLENPESKYASVLGVLPKGSDNIKDAKPLAETAQEEPDKKIVYAEVRPQMRTQIQTDTLYETVENVVQQLSQPESVYAVPRDVKPHTGPEKGGGYMNLSAIQEERRKAAEKKAADPEGHYANFKDIEQQRKEQAQKTDSKPPRLGK